jgi:hypothetical protein
VAGGVAPDRNEPARNEPGGNEPARNESDGVETAWSGGGLTHAPTLA